MLNMKYRKFGNTKFEVSVLSFGACYLDSMNENKAIELIQCAVDQGINYFDLGHPYDMETYRRRLEVISEALRGNYLEKAKISLTFPIASINSISDLNHYLDEYLRTLRASRIDFCVIGELNRETWPKIKKLNIIEWVDKTIEEGKIGIVGFSFHDDTPYLRDIITAYKGWAFCQIKYSYVDVNHHPGITGLKYAASNGLAVVVTDPFKGGNLLKKPPEPVTKYWEELLSRGSLAEWGLRWIWNHPEVSTVVVDFNGVEQMLEYIALVEKSDANNLSVQELIAFENIKDAYLKMRPIKCATCYCCMPCPQGINVPRVFELYEDAIAYDDAKTSRFYYKIEGHRIEDCNECGECVKKCPRKIPIIDWLKKARGLLSQ